MAGLFDDLIPAKPSGAAGAPAGNGGLDFSDLVPGSSPQKGVLPEITITKPGAPNPEQQVGISRSGGWGDTADAAIRGVADMMTFGLGDEISAALGAATGIGGKYGDYAGNLAAQRAVDASDAENQPAARIGGQVLGAVAMPGGALSSSTRLGRLAEGAAKGAAAGAAYGFGSGEGAADRMGGAATGGAVGGVLGGALGGILPGASKPPPSTNTPVQAAERLGVQLPQGVASNSMVVQQAGQVVRNVPFAGQPVVKAAQNAIGQLGSAADNVAESLGGTTPAAAGATVRDAIGNKWAKAVKDQIGALYDRVDTLVNPEVRSKLSSTQQTVSEILAQRQASRINDPGKAVSFVADAVTDPTGLTYQGIKGLRTRVGEMLDNPSLIPADVSQAELRRIYGSLTNDLKTAVQTSGGDAAASAFDRANRYNALVSKRREDLRKLLNVQSDEAVYNRIVGAASTGGSANLSLLAKARKAIGPEAWDEVAGTVASGIGRDPAGNFSPDRFMTDWNKMTKEGKSLLFGTTGNRELRQSLDDIAAVSSRFKELNKFANPSGTAQNVTGAGIGASLFYEPVTAISSLVGANLAARILAAPATAKGMSRWSKAYEFAVRKPTRGTVDAFRRVSSEFGSLIGRELGIPNVAQSLYGAMRAPAENGQMEVPGPRNDQQDQRGGQ